MHSCTGYILIYIILIPIQYIFIPVILRYSCVIIWFIFIPSQWLTGVCCTFLVVHSTSFRDERNMFPHLLVRSVNVNDLVNDWWSDERVGGWWCCGRQFVSGRLAMGFGVSVGGGKDAHFPPGCVVCPYPGTVLCLNWHYVVSQHVLCVGYVETNRPQNP